MIACVLCDDVQFQNSCICVLVRICVHLSFQLYAIGDCDVCMCVSLLSCVCLNGILWYIRVCFSTCIICVCVCV